MISISWLILILLFCQFCLHVYIYWYRLGTVNSKSFIGKVLLRIKWKYELNVYFKHEMIVKW